MEKTKGKMVFDGLQPGQHTYCFPLVSGTPGQEDEVRDYKRIEPGDVLDVDLKVNPELRGPLSTGAARWQEDEPRRKAKEPREAEGG